MGYDGVEIPDVQTEGDQVISMDTGAQSTVLDMSKTTVGDNPNYEGETKENEIESVEEYDPAGKVQNIGVRNPNFENDEKIKNVPETQADPIISIGSESLASIIDETTTPVSENSKITPDEDLVKPEIQPVEPDIQLVKPETLPENAQSSGLEDLLSGSGNDLLSPVTAIKSESEKTEMQPPGSSLDLLGNSLL